MPRFSKAVVAEYVTKRLRAIQAKRHFKTHYGWTQVCGLGGEANRDYGEFAVLLELAEEFDLPLDDIG